jgi:hypothetical protein
MIFRMSAGQRQVHCTDRSPPALLIATASAEEPYPARSPRQDNLLAIVVGGIPVR